MESVQARKGAERNAAAAENQEAGAAKAPAEPLPIRVRIDGVEYPLSKLEQSAFVLHAYFGSLIPPQRFNFHFVFELEGETYEVPTHGTLRRLEDARMRASFFAPQPYHQRLMRKVLRRAGRGLA